MERYGVVKFFSDERGYGFIKPDDGGADIFVHVSALAPLGLDRLDLGQRIAFETEPHKEGQGPKAVKLRPG
jgi:CspA family cold shock protein